MRASIKKLVILLPLLLLLPAVVVWAQNSVPQAPTVLDPRIERGFWQYGVDTERDAVRLAIRDKGGQVGTYSAIFVVTAPDKRQYSFTKDGSGITESVAFFPRDFNAAWRKGVYTWSCTIGGRTMVQGSFEYCTSCQIRLLQAGFVPVRSSQALQQ
jgi:hypothetical protein